MTWETPAAFSRRLGLRTNAFSRKIRRHDCPQNFEAVEGPTGRIIKLRASVELEDFMRVDIRKAINRPRHAKIVTETARRLSYGKD